MEVFKVVFTPKAREDLSGLDKAIAQRILDKVKWLSQNTDAIRHNALTGQFAGVLKLRVGDWRILYDVDHAKRELIVRMIRHRREAYKSRS